MVFEGDRFQGFVSGCWGNALTVEGGILWELGKITNLNTNYWIHQFLH